MTQTETAFEIEDQTSTYSSPEALRLTLEVTDPELIEALMAFSEGRERQRFALNALRVGILATRTATGTIDGQTIRHAGEKLLGDIRHLLHRESAEMTGSMTEALRRYLDPESGALTQKLEALTKDGGDLERLLDQHVGPDRSKIAETLRASLGENSPLLQMLSPNSANGLLFQLHKNVTEALDEQRKHILREFSLDNKESALSLLLGELGEKHDSMCKDVGDQTEELFKELSLDHPDSALSRLVGRVEQAQKTLTREFSLDEDSSSLSRLSRLIEDGRKEIDRHLTLDDEGSALSRIRRELGESINALAKSHNEFHTEVRESIAALRAQRQEAERGTRHGHTFEQELQLLLTKLAQGYGDPHEATGATTGAIKNCKVGDFVTTLAADAAGAGANIVWEAKEDQSYTLKKALDEIEVARKNRTAQIGVFVISSKSAPDGLATFARYGQAFVVIWDSDDPTTDVFIRAAYAAARGLAQAESTSNETRQAVIEDIERATRAIEKQIRYLDDFQKSAGAIESHAGKIAERARKMTRELGRQVESLDRELAALRTE